MSPGLWLFLTVTAIAIVAFRIVVWRADDSRNLATPAVPAQPDPIEIAYLRSGRGDVLRTTLIGLQERGAIDILPAQGKSKAKFVRTMGMPGTPFEAEVLGALRTPADFSEIAKVVGPVMTTYLQPYQMRLSSERLLTDATTTRKFQLAAVGIAIGLGLFAYALSRFPHAGVSGLVSLWIAYVTAFFALLVLLSIAGRPRLTSRGRRYLKRLLASFPSRALQKQLASIAREKGFAPPGDPAGSAVLLAPLLVGLYGVGSLASTRFEPTSRAMKPVRPDGSGGCSMSFDGGGSCGCCGSSGGCGGGSCGGGGCGGGGCGA